MCEFRLKCEKLQNLGILEVVVAVQLCLVLVPYTFCMVVPVPLVSVPVPIGFCWVVPVPPCFGTGTTSWFCPELFLFALFGTNYLHTTSPFHNTSKTTWNLTQNNSTTLELVIWNFIKPNPRRKSENSTQGPPIPTKPHNFDGFHVYFLPTRVFPTKLQEF